jgi:hypothetical protein
MRRSSFASIWLLLWILLFVGSSWAQCPEDPNDNGVCDTLYIEIWPGDDLPVSFPHYARFPIRVTNDIPDASIDSIAGFVIPLCFTSANPSANAEIEANKNNGNLYPSPDLNNSIFRHLPSMEDPQERNFMMDLSEPYYLGLAWDTRILDIGGGDHFWMSLVASGSQDQRFKGGSRVLVATMTFTIIDTTTICIDTCFWPPTGRLAFSRADAFNYFPRHFLPVCQDISFPCPMAPYFTDGVADQYHTTNGHYVTDDFVAVDYVCGPIEQVGASFHGEGVENVTVVVDYWWDEVVGHVEYDVTDSCASGGYVTLYAENGWGAQGWDEFRIYLPNDPPHLTLSDTWRALAGYTMLLEVTGVDPDGDIMGDIELDAFWYEGDSLRPPTNPPSYEPGNPGNMTWAFAESDTGVWICLFWLSDSCGAEGLDTLAIGVGLPFCGDCTDDGEINVADVVCLIGYLYKQGTPPEPLCKGDASGNGSIDVGDVVLMINYLFKGSFSPCFDCCDEG